MGKNNKETKTTNLIILITFLCIVFLTIGFSAIEYVLNVRDINAVIRIEKDIRITNLRKMSELNNATSTAEDFNYDFITSSISLPNSNSSITYDIEITNIGNVEMGLTDITGLPSNLEYTVTGYTMEAALCDDIDNTKCSLGSVTTIHLTIGYGENGYNELNTNYNLNLTFVFEEMLYTARIGSQYYLTIQEAIDASPTDGTETTIVLLKNVYQRIQIWRGNNIVLDMPNLVLHNKEFVAGSVGDPVVEIFGARDKQHKNSDNTSNVGTAIFKMINGSIITEANQGAINVELGGSFIMTGGSIIASGNRQAVFVKAGATANISGTSYLNATAEIDTSTNPPNYRATVQNKEGTLTITGGTIEASGPNGIALTSESTTTIGTKDGTVSTTTPSFISTDTGIYVKSNTTFNFYDGIAKGKAKAFTDENEIDDIETGYDIAHSGEIIESEEYHTAFLGQTVLITFDPNGGTLPASELTRNVAIGSAIGPLPVPTYIGHELIGWYNSNNQLVQPGTIINAADTLTASWKESAVAINVNNNTEYTSLQAAINAAPANTKITIQLLKNTSEKITIGANKNIEFDFGSYILSNTGSVDVITNNGTLSIISGTLKNTGTKSVIVNNKILTISGGTIDTSSANASAINNTAGATLEITGGSITATGLRQAIYDTGGVVRISGSVILSSKAKVESGKPRATVQSDSASSNIYITGGTIISTATNGIAVTNKGTLTIGTEDGNISTTSPVIRGTGKGVYSTSTLYIYDGILESISTPLDGTTTAIEANSTPATGTENIDGQTYNTWYLQSTS
ncbi:MAG: InlB B-repeat-containing protein [Bacilli bacterium]|nr:InlB B-repeat-containing protein [Bacilli bacterium]